MPNNPVKSSVSGNCWEMTGWLPWFDKLIGWHVSGLTPVNEVLSETNWMELLKYEYIPDNTNIWDSSRWGLPEIKRNFINLALNVLM